HGTPSGGLRGDSPSADPVPPSPHCPCARSPHRADPQNVLRSSQPYHPFPRHLAAASGQLTRPFPLPFIADFCYSVIHLLIYPAENKSVRVLQSSHKGIHCSMRYHHDSRH